MRTYKESQFQPQHLLQKRFLLWSYMRTYKESQFQPQHLLQVQLSIHLSL